MSMMKEALLLAVEGFQKWMGEYRLLAPAMGILLYALFSGKWGKENRERDFVIYAGGMMVVLLCPLTAVLFLSYQTRFYDYAWVWSLVPLTGFVAWGIVNIVYKEAETFRKRGFLIAAVLLILCGNQGVFFRTTPLETGVQESAELILQHIEENLEPEDQVIWGPAPIMQYLRAHNGQVELFYGKDMWDGKSGAYDYEAYSQQETECYQWMESVSAPHNLYLMETNQTNELIQLSLANDGYLQEAVDRGVNLIIFPDQITPWVKRKLDALGEKNSRKLRSVPVGEYILWILE